MTSKTYQHLSQEQRYTIEALVTAGHTQSFIAEQISVNKSTVSRELSRNSIQKVRPPDRYKASLAQDFTERRAYKPAAFLSNDPCIVRRMCLLLKIGWSPDQIAANCADRGIAMMCAESIYLWIYANREGEDYTVYLRRHHRKRRKRKLTRQPRVIIKDRVSIDERPDIVDRQERYGDMETDLIKCTNGYILTITERKSLYNLLVKIPNKKAETIKRAFVGAVLPLKGLVHTVTSDNGTEFAKHKEISRCVGVPWYFADPYCPQQRGCNENQNGLARQYLKRNTDLSKMTDADIMKIQNRLNNRPRKKNNYKSPNKIFLNRANVALVS